MADSSALADAGPPPRTTGIWPMALKSQAVLRCSKYSALATNVTRRFSMIGRNTESEKLRWLLARITGPLAGTFSMPSTLILNNSRKIGPRTPLKSRYTMSRQGNPAGSRGVGRMSEVTVTVQGVSAIERNWSSGQAPVPFRP